MHDIVLIESAKLTKDEDVELIAILENMDASLEAKKSWIAPGFAPIKCRTKILRSSLPHWIQLRGLTSYQLGETVKRYANLSKQEWEAMVPKFRDPNPSTK
jgi:hypothetical protein